ncbi:MAG: hypothetical protein AAF675_00030 [Pseudomonadota bacterium]
MSASDDIQFDMSAALVGVMVVLFYLVYEETRFEQSPGEGTVRLELLYLEDPLPATRYADFTWPVIISEGAAVGNPTYELDFNASFEGYEYASNEVRCRLDDSVQAVWQVNTAAPSLRDPRGYQGFRVAGEVALEDTIYAEADLQGTRGNFADTINLTPLPGPWATLISNDDLQLFLPGEILVDGYLLPTTPGAVGPPDYFYFDLEDEGREALGRGRNKSSSFSTAHSGLVTEFHGKNPAAAMDPELLRGILRHPLAQRVTCSLTGQSIHAAQQISVHFDPPGCGVMGGCASGFQSIRLIGLRYRTPQGREWVTWDFSQGLLEGVEFTPDVTRNADGTYALTAPTRIAVGLN